MLPMWVTQGEYYQVKGLGKDWATMISRLIANKHKELGFFSRKSGGVIFMDRVGGQLAVTRSIGDFNFRTLGVIPNPHIVRRVLKPSDKWIIMATDGVWDIFSD